MMYSFLDKFHFGEHRCECVFKVDDLKGDAGMTCNMFNYGIHLANDYVNGREGIEHFLAMYNSC